MYIHIYIHIHNNDMCIHMYIYIYTCFVLYKKVDKVTEEKYCFVEYLNVLTCCGSL